MKISLINPPQTYPLKYYDKSSLRAQIPIGLMQIASVLEQNRHEVKIIDAFTISKNIISESGGIIHFGAGWDAINEEIKKSEPDVIGITSPFTSQLKNARIAADMVKKANKRIPIILGGPHASIRPDDFLEHVDVVVMGEGEYSIIEIVDAINKKKGLSGIKGIAFKKKRKVVKNPLREHITDLDSLPFPAYHLINLERYFEMFRYGLTSRPHSKSNRVVPMITSRGCPFNCCFCSIHLHMGKKWRANSAEYVVKHIKHIVDKYNVKHISFEDDNLTFNKKRFDAILNGIIQNKFNITWDTPNGVRADMLNEYLIRKAKKSGCTRLVVGVESGDQDVLNNIVDKKLDLNKVIEIAKICKKLNLDLHAFFVIGFPGETKENIKKTFDFAFMLMKKYDVVPAFNVANPLIGTRLYDVCKEKGCLVKELSPENIMLGSPVKGGSLIKTKEFTPKYLRKSIKEFYKRVAMQQFLKPRYIVKRFMRDPKTFMLKAKNLVHFAFSDKVK